MNRRIFGVTIGTLLCICCAERGVRATTHTGGRIATTGQMTVARFDHAAVLLRTGRVLRVGGLERNGVMQPTSELFDPVTGRFTMTGEPQANHGWGVTATLLPDGKVLVAGGSSGCDSPCYTASAELYDPATGKFASTGKMTVPRAEARAILLKTGEVLLVGGTATTNRNPLLTAELYHPIDGYLHFGRCNTFVRCNGDRAAQRWPSTRSRQFGIRSVRPIYKAFRGNRGNDGSS